jgi:hypothetical protein
VPNSSYFALTATARWFPPIRLFREREAYGTRTHCRFTFRPPRKADTDERQLRVRDSTIGRQVQNGFLTRN